MKPVLHRGLYIITDCSRLAFAAVQAHTAAMLQAGVAAVQYRDKEAGHGERVERAGQLLELCRAYQTPLIVNDDVDAALTVGADGVHVGSDDAACSDARRRLGDNALIGVSCYNSLERARTARVEGADYLAFGAFFATGSKERTVPASTELLRAAREELDLPLAAIGGITPDNCRPLLEAGADLLAVISSVYLAADPASEVARFNRIFQSV